MNFYTTPIRPDELRHHGILGQKWGVRNGPPYPLGPSDHSSTEKAAGWRKSLKDKSGRTYYQSRKTKKYNTMALRSKEAAEEWDELAQYARKNGLNKRAKKFEKHAADELAEFKKYANRAKRSSEIDLKMQSIRMAQSKGEKVVQTILQGPFGKRYYADMAKALGADWLAVDQMVVGDLATVNILYSRNKYIKQDEKR